MRLFPCPEKIIYFQSESVPQEKSISNMPLSDNAYLHSGNDGYQDDATRCKEKHVNNPGQEIEYCSRRKRDLQLEMKIFYGNKAK